MIQTELRILQTSRESYEVYEILFSSEETIQALYHQAQKIAMVINAKRKDPAQSIKASDVYAAGVIRLIQRDLVQAYSSAQQIDIKDQVLTDYRQEGIPIPEIIRTFDAVFPHIAEIPESAAGRLTVEEILLLEVSQNNPRPHEAVPGPLQQPAAAEGTPLS